MSAIKFFKVESIPTTLEPNSIYLVNDDEEDVEIYFSDITGTHLFPLNVSKYTGIGMPNVTRKLTPKIVGDVIAGSLTTTPLVNRRLYLIPYLTTRPLTLTSLRISVTTAQANTTVSIGIYANILFANDDVNPYILLASVSNLPTHQNGDVSGAISFTLRPNTLYWFGIISSGGPALRSVPTSSALSLGRIQNSASAVTYLYKDLPLFTLPIVAPFDLLAGTGSFPAIYLVE